MSDSLSPRFGFLMEQTLGHVTHYRNLRAAVDADPRIRAAWYPLGFPPRGGLETLPPLRTNWTVRGSLRARRLLPPALAASHDALFFHTQTITVLSRATIARVPSVISLDATPMNYDAVGAAYGHHARSGPAEVAKRALYARPLRAAAAVVVWCDWARRSLVADYGVPDSRITVIAPGVDLTGYRVPFGCGGELDPSPGYPPKRVAASRVPLAAPRAQPEVLPGTGLRVLFVGADFARKGGPLLLEAAAALGDRCELHLVTRTPLSPRPGVHVYPDLGPNSPMLRQLYARADLFVLPTLADCFPLVVQEAMAAGLPVVASDLGAIGEAVADGQTGLLIPPGDGRALRGAIEALAEDQSMRRRLGEQGRAVAEQRFDSARNATRIVDLLLTVARRPADGKRR